jgi:hypothetical protein
LKDFFFALFISFHLKGISELQIVILLPYQVFIVHLSIWSVIIAIVVRITTFHLIITIHHLRVLLMINVVTACIIVLIVVIVHLAHSIVHVVNISSVTSINFSVP